MKRWIAIAVIAGALGVGWAWIKTRPLVLPTVQPAVGDIAEFVAEDGKTRLDQEYIITMPIAGRIFRIELGEGDAVTSGQVLARIDDFDLRQQLAKAYAQIEELRRMIEGVDQAKPKPEDIEAARLKVNEAALQLQSASRATEIARINFADAERELRRMETLLADKVVQRAQFDAAKRAYDTARETLANSEIHERAASQTLEIARVAYDRICKSVDDNEYQRGVHLAQIQQTSAGIALLRDQLAKTVIRSPANGLVLERYVKDEQVLPAGTPLLKIGDMESIEIEADILSEEVGRVRAGQKAEISGKALGGRIIEGTVKRIYPGGFKKISALGIEQQRVKVIVAFDNCDVRLRPYVSVDLRIIVDERRKVLTVPEQAVFKSGDQWAVFVIRGGRLVLQPISIGLRNDLLVEVTDGLTTSARVVAEPTNDLREGLRAK
ncbi:MAG: efflux RND transporter periplasmic adaptor subunit [Candidatus Sumerlaeia bacterium]|nr:efflux RND transporter periplasmic adaptor subunit [Candidatus Sumerlaeia bacterium]